LNALEAPVAPHLLNARSSSPCSYAHGNSTCAIEDVLHSSLMEPVHLVIIRNQPRQHPPVPTTWPDTCFHEVPHTSVSPVFRVL